MEKGIKALVLIVILLVSGCYILDPFREKEPAKAKCAQKLSLLIPTTRVIGNEREARRAFEDADLTLFNMTLPDYYNITYDEQMLTGSNELVMVYRIDKFLAVDEAGNMYDFKACR